MKNSTINILDIVLRYFILALVAVPNLWLFYMLFTPLTVYPVYWLISLVYNASVISKDVVLINQFFSIELTKACIAGSAYYLLLILNLSTPKISLSKRAKMIVFSFVAFLIVNILRIFILSIVAVSGSGFFDITHRIFWYSLSTIFVVAIWFAEIWIFKIKEIPFYSDINFLYKNIKK